MKPRIKFYCDGSVVQSFGNMALHDAYWIYIPEYRVKFDYEVAKPQIAPYTLDAV